MMSGILSPVFLQSAGRAGKGGHVGKITLFTQLANPSIYMISCTGEIKVSSIYNGEKKVQTYSDLNNETLSIQADANTQIVISGAEITHCEFGENTEYKKISVTALTELNCSGCYALTALDLSKNTALTTLICDNCYALTALDLSKNTALTTLGCEGCYVLTALDLSKNTALATLDCDNCYALTALDLSKNTALTTLNCGSCYVLTSLDLSKNTALTTLNCGSCYALTALDLSKNTALTELNCDSCYALTALDLSKNTALTTLICDSCQRLISISYQATNSDVSTAVAGAITDADSTTGTVYTDSAAAYYSTIATAATTKGWTIKQIPA